MATTTVNSSLSNEDIDIIIKDIEKVLTGRAQDKHRIKDTFYAAFAESMFESIHTAFLEKSESQQDEVGTKWKPLARSTIAARPIRKGEKKGLGIRGRTQRGLLTKRENKLWEAIFRSRFVQLAPRIGESAAKIEAGKLAWGVLKKKGAKTKLEVLGSRNVPIGIVTHALEKSLRPTKARGPSYRPRKNQIFKKLRGGIELGSSIDYAEFFHEVRELWPDGDRIELWQDRAVQAGVTAVVERLAKIMAQRT